MRVRENLSSIISSIGKNNFTPSNKLQVGRAYGIVTVEKLIQKLSDIQDLYQPIE